MDSGNEYRKLRASEDAKFALKLGVNLFGFKFTGAAEKDGDDINLSACSDSALNIMKLVSAAAENFGLEPYIPKAFDFEIERHKTIITSSIHLLQI